MVEVVYCASRVLITMNVYSDIFINGQNCLAITHGVTVLSVSGHLCCVSYCVSCFIRA